MNYATRSHNDAGVHLQLDLSDGEIEEALQRAEARLSAKGATAITSKSDEAGVLQSVAQISRFAHASSIKPYIMTQKEVAKANDRDLVDQKMRELADAQNSVTTVPTKQERKAQKSQKATAGSSWFDLPKTNLTPELKRDLQILGMRSVLDPKRHYKKENGKIRPPEFSQVGTIIEGPTEYYSGRLLNRERRKNLVEDILAGEATTGRFKRKYEDIQKTKTSGKKAHYKALKEKRRSTRV